MKFPLNVALPCSLAALAMSSCLAALTGCGMTPLTTSELAAAGLAMKGAVHGGQQPIANSHVYLMAASTSGYGAASVSLLTSGDGSDSVGTYVLTDAGGGFAISGDYACTPGTQVYVLAMGGNPGLSDGTNNTAVELMDALGTCPANGTFLGAIPSIAVNEATTVAAAFALAPFATDTLHIGSGSSTLSQQGLANAFATAANLVDPTTGTVLSTTPAVAGYSAADGLSANGVVPAAKINTLANIAAGCVNSMGTGPACSQFFNHAVAGGVTPTGVGTALMNVAHAPASNVATLFYLNGSIAPFQPSLGVAPTDWTLAVQYSAPNVSAPGRIAFDAGGNLWVPDAASNSLAEMSATGTVLSGTAGFTGGGMSMPSGVGVNPSNGNVYATNANGNVLSVFDGSGNAVSSTGYATMDANYAVAFDSAGNALMAGTGGLESESLGGVVQSLAALSDSAYGVTAASNDVAWGVSYMDNTLNTVVAGTPTSYSGGGLSAPTAMATDAAGNFWIANSGNNSVSEFGPDGSVVSSTGMTGGGIHAPWGISVDGDGFVWVANDNGTVSKLDSTGTALSPATGFASGSIAAAQGMAIDGSGNVWVSNADGSLNEFVGAGAPVVTPMTNTRAGVRP